jgi:hypothetical protein
MTIQAFLIASFIFCFLKVVKIAQNTPGRDSQYSDLYENEGVFVFGSLLFVVVFFSVSIFTYVCSRYFYFCRYVREYHQSRSDCSLRRTGAHNSDTIFSVLFVLYVLFTLSVLSAICLVSSACFVYFVHLIYIICFVCFFWFVYSVLFVSCIFFCLLFMLVLYFYFWPKQF